MKKQFGTSRFTVALLVMIGALAITTTASARNPKEVKMTIEDDQLVITTKKNKNDCPWRQKRGNGCIKVKRNEKSELLFHLTGNTKCNLGNGTRWELNAVYLGGYNSDDKPNEFGFDDTDDADYDKVNSDFTIVDRTSGQVNLTEKSAKKLAIYNTNQYEYVVWYKIEAICERSDGGEPHFATSDPRVRNSGTD
ncbi:MAG: hypothetical protein QNK22_10475 [Xanthomonadales bacterium]|nr:hypothetical protein [Xanthomonadales bacterium]